MKLRRLAGLGTLWLGLSAWGAQVAAEVGEIEDRVSGAWRIDGKLGAVERGERPLFGKGERIQFEKDRAVLEQLPANLKGKVADPVLAGRSRLGSSGSERVFVLGREDGGMVLWLSAGRVGGEWTSFRAILVRADEKERDLLLLGEAGGQGFSAVLRREVGADDAGGELKLSVPEPATPKQPLGELIIDVGKDGSLAIDGRGLGRERLAEKLTEVGRRNPDQPVILRGDRQTRFEHIVAVLEICQKAGIWNVAFATAAAPGMRAEREALRAEREALEQVLPKVPAAEGAEEIAIAMARDGGLSLDGKSVSLTQLEKRLRAKQRDGRKLRVVLSADDEGKTESFIELVNLLGKLEIMNITMVGFRDDPE